MGRKYNLNFDADNVFELGADAKRELQNGSRANIVWMPLQKYQEGIRWSSYEQIDAKSQIQMVRHQRNESQGIRLIEEQVCDPKFSSNLKGKASLNFLDPNRLTQVTRDTNAFASSVADNLVSERAAGDD